MRASALNSSVGIHFIEHYTLIFHEFPGARHPATTACTIMIFIAKLFPVIIGINSAVYQLLLWKMHWVRVRLDGKCSLGHWVGDESPARSTRSLIFDSEHFSFSCPVNIKGISNKITAFPSSFRVSVSALSSLKLIAIFCELFWHLAEAKQALILFIWQISSPV